MENNLNQKKVAIYCRVSTSEQTNENQKLTLEKYCKDRGLTYDIFEEKESSRKTRPVKQELLYMLRHGVYTGVIVYKIDRWGRSLSELVNEITEFQRKGIGFTSISDNLDFSTASGMLHFGILSAFAEFERALISERTKEGLKRAKHEGKFLGRPKGSKDKKVRPKSGYIIREAKKRKDKDTKENNVHLPINHYIDNRPSGK